MLYTGTNANFPADRWSYVSNTSDFQRFFLGGAAMGYGLAIAGLEVAGQPDQPLLVRDIEPNSPAAAAGLQRGDQLVSVNGIPSATLISSGDYSALSPSAPGQSVALQVHSPAGDRSVSLISSEFSLVPVRNAAVLTTPMGTKMGYLIVKDMIGQALSPANDAFGQFKAAGVQEVVLDLRYNGGGYVSVAEQLASFPAAASTAGKLYATLTYNADHQGDNVDFIFDNWVNSLNLSRVYVLTGPRTCSASEQLINGLRPFVDVVTIGDTTCGKPVGFDAVDDGCGSTWSAVTFETSNALKQGRYFDGLTATCPVAEDFHSPLGSAGDPLLAAAQQHADGGGCPGAAAATRTGALGVPKAPARRPLWQEPGERRGMWAR